MGSNKKALLLFILLLVTGVIIFWTSCPVVERERTLFVDISGLSRGPGWIVAKCTLDDLPGPRGLPFLGNIHQLDLTKVHLILERWAAQYGLVYLLRMGSKRVVALSDPKWCDQVLRARPETFSRHSRVAPVYVFAYNSPRFLARQGKQCHVGCETGELGLDPFDSELRHGAVSIVLSLLYCSLKLDPLSNRAHEPTFAAPSPAAHRPPSTSFQTPQD
jgi:hypothetical protein